MAAENEIKASSLHFLALSLRLTVCVLRKEIYDEQEILSTYSHSLIVHRSLALIVYPLYTLDEV